MHDLVHRVGCLRATLIKSQFCQRLACYDINATVWGAQRCCSRRTLYAGCYPNGLLVQA